jgi:hypothetical protein
MRPRARPAPRTAPRGRTGRRSGRSSRSVMKDLVAGRGVTHPDRSTGRRRGVHAPPSPALRWPPAGRGGDEGLADQHRVGAEVRGAQDVVGAADAGFGDGEAVGGEGGTQPRERVAVDVEGPQVPGVDPDDAAPTAVARASSASSWTSTSTSRPALSASAWSCGQRRVVERRHDQQDGGRAGGTGLPHLVRVDGEVLAQARDTQRGDRREVLERALEPAGSVRTEIAARPATYHACSTA